MMKAKAITTESFAIADRGIIVELNHNLDGLPKGTELKSSNSGKRWIVKSRVLFDHAVQVQIIFDNETTESILNRFDSIEKKEKSIKRIREREASSVYQYFLSSEDHGDKPEHGEELEIKLPTTKAKADPDD